MGPKKEAKKEVVEEPVVQLPPPIPPHELSGYGKFQYGTATYEGEWHLFNGIKMKHGKGKLVVAGVGFNKIGGESYEGNWKMDKMDDYGIYHYADGSIYRGNWKDNVHFGRGQYQFPNGTLYEGQWQGHLMHGSGYYIDTNGKKWDGEYRNGKFQTKGQEELVKEKKIKVKKDQIKGQIQALLISMLENIAKSDKKTLKDNMSVYFANDAVKQYVKEPYPKLQQRPPEKWTQVLNLAKSGSIKVLESQTEGEILNADRILKKQMQGNGQITQIIGFKDQRTVKLCFVNVDANWILVFAQDDEKKK